MSTATGGYFVPYLVLMSVAVLGMLNAVCMDDRLIGRNYISDKESD